MKFKLLKNINNLSNRISIIPIPLDKSNSLSEMEFVSSELGGALSSFKHKIGHDGKSFKSVFQVTLCIYSTFYRIRYNWNGQCIIFWR